MGFCPHLRFFVVKKAAKKNAPHFLKWVRYGTLLRTHNSLMFFSLFKGRQKIKEPKEKTASRPTSQVQSSSLSFLKNTPL